MFNRLRQIERSSRLQSKFGRTPRRGREYVVSICITAIVHGMLVVFLIMSAFRSHVIMRDKFPETASYLRVGVPFGILFIALIFVRSFVGNVRKCIEASGAGKDDGEAS